MKYLFIYIGIMSLITFITFGIDKYKAIKEKYRIPESTLLLLSLGGGVCGGLLGMYLFHHKIRKKKFTILLPLFLLLWCILIVVIWRYI